MPLLWLSITFIIGILIAGWFNPPVFAWILLSALGFIFIFLEKFLLRHNPAWKKIRAHVPVYPGLLLLLISLGGARYLLGQPLVAPHTLAYYNDRGTYTITARISAPPDYREDAVYIDVSTIEIEDPLATNPLEAVTRIKGNARVRFPAFSDYQLGDVLRFTATPLTPSEDERFSYKDYLARQQISTVMYYPRSVTVVDHVGSTALRGGLETARQFAKRVIYSTYPQPESSLIAGILLGLDQDIPGSLEKAYQKTGTAHIIAISGFNMAVLALVFSWLFSRFFNRYLAALFSGIAIIIYTIFVGASPAVVRAAIMAVTAFGGHLVGRRQAGLNALAFTAALMCLFNPLLLGDVSFQLSFAATLGLVLFADPLKGWADNQLNRLFSETNAKKASGLVSEYLLFTLAAQLLTLPVIAYHFGRVSTTSLLANPLILPAQPPLLILGGISTILGAMSPFLGKIVSLFTWPLARYSNFISESFSRLNFGNLVVNSQVTVLLIVVVILFILLLVFRRFLTRIFKGNFYWLLFFLLVGTFSIYSIIAHRPDGYLHVDLLRAGDDSALVMRTPAGQTLLFDPGKQINETSAAVSRQLSPWRFQLDQVWLSSASSAKYLAELNERIPLRSVILPPVAYQAGAESKPVTIPPELTATKLQPGEGIKLDGELTISVAAENTDSAAFLISYNEISILIPNGVDYALIREQSPEVLHELSVLVLQEADISYIPPRVWQSLAPRAVLWNSPVLCPIEGWLSLDDTEQISIYSDGVGIYLSQ